MGLDIRVCVDNHDSIFTKEYNEFASNHELSRTFCNFMSRKDVIYEYDFLPELNQIGVITGLEISLLYEMENYPNEEWQAVSIEMAESDSERITLKAKFQQQKDALSGNLNKVYVLIDNLINRLSTINNLLELLVDTDYDTFDYGREHYFSDFNIDKGDGYMRNNLGQDLRNFKRFLEYVKERGTTTVYFEYG